MRVLGIDTSTKTTAIGLIEDEKVLAEYNLTGLVYHSESVTDMIEEIFDKFDFELSDIDLISVGVGPGSFTGLRIGITIAKVMSFSLNKDVIGVSSLVANAMNEYGKVLNIVDARRGNVYACFVENKNDIKILIEDKMTSFEEIKNVINKYENVIITGIDGNKFIDELPNARLSLNPSMSGVNIAKLGLIEFEKRGADNAFNLVPNYFKLSQAEKENGKDN